MLRDLLGKGDFMVKIGLKDAYFTVPIWKKTPKVSEVCLEGNDVRVCCLPFWFASAPKVFTKLMKPVVGLPRQLGIRLIAVYLDDICNDTFLVPLGLLFDQHWRAR